MALNVVKVPFIIIKLVNTTRFRYPLRKILNLPSFSVMYSRKSSIVTNTKETNDSSNKNATSQENEDDAETHFGFERVKENEKANRVRSVFSNVATRYDLMNDVMSGGIHRLWKDYFIKVLSPTPGTKLLDVAGGTGDIAFRFLQAVQYLKPIDENIQLENPFDSSSELLYNESRLQGPESLVVVCDINPDMLEVGKKKAKEHGIGKGIFWKEGDAENLPFPNNSFDAYTIAFGIRNITHIDLALCEAFRVLKPGGRFLCLEFSQVDNGLLNWAYDLYSFQVIPVMGQLFAQDWRSYQYLVESIRNFPPQETFAEMIEEAGFKAVSYENLLGGIAAVHSAFKLKFK
ncbi:ubiquinone biosynthesis protein COQ3, mitochondrial [Tachypleus tridentatus]|uniref:ubiquinone biosynthesis protein COQ3, mitochondrial n=1 Tax=Tachypleus tridentatus TaxID=6853 RepID=UPI003FCFF043